MKSEVKYIRGNLSQRLWTFTQEVSYLQEDNWTDNAWHELLTFEEKILDAMKTGGWDGVENPDRLQWTRMGALFYSIIVITTIGELINTSFFYLFHFSLLIFVNLDVFIAERKNTLLMTLQKSIFNFHLRYFSIPI